MADTNPFASVGLSQFRAEGGADGLGSNLLSMGTAYAIDQSGLFANKMMPNVRN